jgi:ABC-2 type transport system permease protein
MEYRIDFLTGAFSFLINQVINILFISIIFSQIPDLQGWNYQQIIFIYGFSLLPKGLDHFCTDNLWKVSYFIVRRGDFDKYLTRPINPLLHVIIEDFQFDALGEFIVGIYLVTSASIKLGLSFGVVDILFLIVAVIFGALIFTSIKIAFAALALWIKRSGSILHMFYMSSDFARYPVTIYNNVIKTIITYIIPFAFTAFYPANYFLTGANPLFNIGGVVVISVILLGISICIWNKGLGAYESAGS